MQTNTLSACGKENTRIWVLQSTEGQAPWLWYCTQAALWLVLERFQIQRHWKTEDKRDYLAAVPVPFQQDRSVVVERLGLSFQGKRPRNRIVSTAHHGWRLDKVLLHEALLQKVLKYEGVTRCQNVLFWHFSLASPLRLTWPFFRLNHLKQNHLVCTIIILTRMRVAGLYLFPRVEAELLMPEYIALSWPWGLIILNSAVLYCPPQCLICRPGQIHSVQLWSSQQEGPYDIQRS